MFIELNVAFTDQEIISACKQIHDGKYGGPEHVLSEFFNFGISSKRFLKVVRTLFYKFFEYGHFPEGWREGFIVSLHKIGDKQCVNN